jgi:hypothetical protein
MDEGGTVTYLDEGGDEGGTVTYFMLKNYEIEAPVI